MPTHEPDQDLWIVDPKRQGLLGFWVLGFRVWGGEGFPKLGTPPVIHHVAVVLDAVGILGH